MIDNFKQLQQGVDRVKDLLGSIQDKMALLRPLANDGQKKTLDKISNLLTQINDFQKNVWFFKQ